MTYVGNPIDTQNTFQSLQGKRFNGDGSTTDFTLDVAPGSVLDIEVFVGNVRQDPNSAYTVSGTTLSFTGAPPSGTNNIYVVHQAKSVGTIDVPALGVSTASIQADAITEAKIADDAVESEHLNNNIISGQTALGAEPADTDEFLVSDAGTIKRVDYSYIKGGTNTPAFLARLSSTTQSISDDTYTKIQFNTEVYDTASAYDNSSNYRFTVPSGQGGKYFIYSAVRMASSSATLTLNLRLNGSNAGFSSLKAVSGELQTILLTYSKDLSAGDYIEIYLRQQSGGSLNASGDSNDQTTYFGGFKLAE